MRAPVLISFGANAIFVTRKMYKTNRLHLCFASDMNTFVSFVKFTFLFDCFSIKLFVLITRIKRNEINKKWIRPFCTSYFRTHRPSLLSWFTIKFVLWKEIEKLIILLFSNLNYYFITTMQAADHFNSHFENCMEFWCTFCAQHKLEVASESNNFFSPRSLCVSYNKTLLQ